MASRYIFMVLAVFFTRTAAKVDQKWFLRPKPVVLQDTTNHYSASFWEARTPLVLTASTGSVICIRI